MLQLLKWEIVPNSKASSDNKCLMTTSQSSVPNLSSNSKQGRLSHEKKLLKLSWIFTQAKKTDAKNVKIGASNFKLCSKNVFSWTK